MVLRKKATRIFQATIGIMIVLAMTVPATAAEPTVNLGTTANFAVLAGSALTNTGLTTIGGSFGGNVGVSPGASVTGFPPGLVSGGTIHAADATALLAQTDLITAYDDAAGRTVTADLTGQDLGGLTLTTGVYSYSSSAQLTGTLVLDAQGDPDAVFIFQIGSTLTTAPSSVVSLVNGARFCRVFWQVGSSATLGTNTNFVGHIFALTSITAQTGATMQGQLLARNGAVTLDTNTITNGLCEAVPATIPATVATPEPTAVPVPTPTPTPVPTPSPVPTPTPTPVPAPTPITAVAPVQTAVAAPAVGTTELPDTGEPDNYMIYVILLVSLALILAFFSWRRKVAGQKS